MVNIPMISSSPLNKDNILSINNIYVQGAKTVNDIQTINNGRVKNNNNAANNNYSSPTRQQSQTVRQPQTQQAQNLRQTQTQQARQTNTINNNTTQNQQPSRKPTPVMTKMIQKGQKVPVESNVKLSKIKACFGWNTSNSQCDLDVSAFLLNNSGKVIGDNWFVFYGQPNSPDNSVNFLTDMGADREIIKLDLSRLNNAVNKIVFVLTINEALEKRLNFSMVSDAYIRIIDETNNAEIVSFQMDEYYSNVISMMIGELYLHNGKWKFSAVGNGVARDLAGLCELYGVQTE